MVVYHSVEQDPRNKDMLKKSFFVIGYSFLFIRFSHLSDAALLSVSN